MLQNRKMAQIMGHFFVRLNCFGIEFTCGKAKIWFVVATMCFSGCREHETIETRFTIYEINHFSTILGHHLKPGSS